MSLPLPSFLRRRLLLLEARRALLAGEPELALGRLGDPCLAGSEGADRLRAQALEVLCRDAERLGEEGRRRSAARLLDRVERESPDLARAWRGRLRLHQCLDPAAAPDPSSTFAATDAGASALRPPAESRIVGAMERLLEQLRGDTAVDPGAARPRAPGVGRGPLPPVGPGGACLRFHLAVDDAGELLFVHGERLVLGHASGGLADLPLLGDVDVEHLVLARVESFHGGPAWRLLPGARPVEMAGDTRVEAGRELTDGDLVRLAPKVAFRYRQADSASGSALLELLHGLECEGATRVVLLAEGPSGRIRLGARLGRHVVVPGLQADVDLEFDRGAGELLVRSEARLEVRGWDPAPLPGGLRLPCPPPARIDVQVGVALPGRPPQGFALRALGPASACSRGGRP